MFSYKRFPLTPVSFVSSVIPQMSMGTRQAEEKVGAGAGQGRARYHHHAQRP